ncbi:MAG: myo-inositol-1(or 4)-monophosphatase [Bacteroidia bacterium]|jgi:myo-inositol-1(or 4)-monophosphatase
MLDYIGLEDKVCTILRRVKKTYFDENKRSFKQLDIKGLNQLVTDMDVAVEKEIIASLTPLLDADFLAEESGESKGNKPFRWILDPIDGTTNFVHGIPVYSISLALQHSGITVGAWVYEINRDELFTATDQTAARCNGVEISVSSSENFNDCLIATGFPYYTFEHKDHFDRILNYCIMNTRGVRRLGSAAVDLAYVACGRFDAFFEFDLSPWDVAAGAYLVERAGGKVSDFKGVGGNIPIFGAQILAGQSKIFDGFLEEIGRLGE